MFSSDAPWHSPAAEDVCARLEVVASKGLVAEQAAQRLIKHGPNALPEDKPKPIWKLLARQFLSPLIYVLFIAAAPAGSLGRGENVGAGYAPQGMLSCAGTEIAADTDDSLRQLIEAGVLCNDALGAAHLE